MSSSAFELANLLGIIAAGRAPQWAEQVDGTDEPEYAGAPDNAGAGVALEDAVVALVCIQLRREAHRRTAFVIPGTFDAATTYRTTINGTNIDSTGATLAALLADIVSDINASGVASVVTAVEHDADGDGTNDCVRVYGDSETDFSIAVTVSGGTGTSTCEADPVTATARVWAQPKTPNAPGRTGTASADPGGWFLVNGATYSVTARNLTERFTVAGFEKLYVELASVTGHGSDSGVTYTPHVFVGPCVQETDS